MHPASPDTWLLCSGPVRSLACLRDALVVFHDQTFCTVFAADGSSVVETPEADIFALDVTREAVLIVGSTGSGHLIRPTADSFAVEERGLEGLTKCRALAVSPTGHTAAAASKRQLLFYNKEQQLSHRLDLQDGAALTRLSWAGSRLVGASCDPDGGILLWSYPGRCAGDLLPGSDASSITCISASPSCSLVAAGYADGQVLLWELREGQKSPAKLLARLSHNAAVQHLAWDARSEQLAVSDGATVSIWSIQGSVPALIAECVGHQAVARITAVAFHRELPVLAVAASMGQVAVYNTASLDAGSQLEPFQRLSVSSHAPCSTAIVTAIAWMEGTMLAAGCDTGRVVTWLVDSPMPEATAHSQNEPQAAGGAEDSQSLKRLANGTHFTSHNSHPTCEHQLQATAVAINCTCAEQLDSLLSATQNCLVSAAPEGEAALNGRHTSTGDDDSATTCSEMPNTTPSSACDGPSHSNDVRSASSAVSEVTSPAVRQHEPHTDSPAAIPHTSDLVNGDLAAHHHDQQSPTFPQHSHGPLARDYQGTLPPPQYPQPGGPPWPPLPHPPMMFVPSPVHIMPQNAMWPPGQPHMMAPMPGASCGMYGMAPGMPMLVAPAMPMPQQWPSVYRPAGFGMMQPTPARVMSPSVAVPGYEARPVWHNAQHPSVLQPQPAQHQQQRAGQPGSSSSGSRRSRRSSSRHSSRVRPPLSPSATSSDFQQASGAHGAAGAASASHSGKTHSTRRGSRGRGGSSGRSSSATGSDLSPNDSLCSPRKGGMAGLVAPVRTIWVGNLAGHIQEQHLCQIFAQYGTITRCEVMRERGTRVSRGFAFLTFEFPPSAAAAMINLNGKQPPGMCQTQPICVDFSYREKEAQHEQLAAWAAENPQVAAASSQTHSPVITRPPHQLRTSPSEGSPLSQGSSAQLARAEQSSKAALAGLVSPSLGRRSSSSSSAVASHAHAALRHAPQPPPPSEAAAAAIDFKDTAASQPTQTQIASRTTSTEVLGISTAGKSANVDAAAAAAAATAPSGDNEAHL